MCDCNLSSTEAHLAHGFLTNVWTDDKILLCYWVDAQIAYQREVKREEFRKAVKNPHFRRYKQGVSCAIVPLVQSPNVVPIVPIFRSLIVPFLHSLMVPIFCSLIMPSSFLSCHRSLICIVPIVPFIVPIVLLSRHETLRNNGIHAFHNNNYENLSLSAMKGHKSKNVSIENHVSMLYFGDPIQHVHELFPQLADKIGLITVFEEIEVYLLCEIISNFKTCTLSPEKLL